MPDNKRYIRQSGSLQIVLKIQLCLSVLLFLGAAGCAPDLPSKGAEEPFIYSDVRIARSDVLVIFIPGAVTSAEVYWRAFDWRDDKTALTFYRLPGFDGLPMDHMIRVEDAADHVAAFADRYPDKEIRIVGYSLGGTIALLAAGRTSSPNVKVAAIAPAPEWAGGVVTLSNGAIDFTRSVWRAGSLNRTQIWREYFQIMLHGRRKVVQEEKAQEIKDFMDQNEEQIIAPSQDIVRAHTWDLRHWHLTTDEKLDTAHTGIFVGLEDPMFSTAQTQRFVGKFGVTKVYGYPGDGHLLLITRPDIFDDIRRFFESAE